MSIIDDALSANATIANDYDSGRGGAPAPKIAIVTGRGAGRRNMRTGASHDDHRHHRL